MTALRVLIIDDSDDDAALLAEELQRSGFSPVYRRVDTLKQLQQALTTESWDILLCDYIMPHLRGPEVLKHMQATRQDIPIIMVSGQIAEDVAVDALHAGAYDYVMKNNLQRLPPAVQRAMREHALKFERKAAQEAIYARSCQQSAMAELGMRALSGIEVSNLIQEALIMVCGVLETQFCEVFELTSNRQQFCLQAATGWDVNLIGRKILMAGPQSEIGFTVQANEPIIVKDVRQDPRFKNPSPLLSYGIVSSICVPIHGQAMPYGILGVHSNSARDFTQSHAHFVQSIANLLGISIARRQAEEESRHMQKVDSLGRLAGGVAHDFNNILTVITGYAELLLKRLPAHNDCYDDIQVIKHSAEQATALTRQLLYFSRKQRAQPRVLELNSQVVNMQTLLQKLIGEDIRLSTTLAADTGSIKIDPGQLHQILMNVSANARDAMPEGGELSIRTQPQENGVLLSISDTGCGMTDETRAHLFEPFFTTKDAGRGTGLGLATIDTIVRQAGGRIDVISSPGRGSTFNIWFPSALQPSESDVLVSGDFQSRTGTETVLVVEDEEVIRTLAQRILTERGYHVLVARHGEEALSLSECHAGRIDLVLTDMIMPTMGGRKFIDAFSQHRTDAKILYMSGYTDRMAEERGLLKEGMNFLQKPFTPHELVRRVRELLDSQKPLA